MMMNNDALNNPRYNPKLSDTQINLYKLMDEPSDEVYQQYEKMFMGFPTSNPYSGVLLNPNHCDIEDVNSEISDLSSMIDNFNISNIPTNYQNDFHNQFLDQNSPTSLVSNLNGGNGVVPNNIQQSINDAKNHTDRLIANLPSILGMVTGALGLASVLGGLLNPCAGTNNFIGSINGFLTPILKGIKSGISKVTGFFKSITSAIGDGISEIMKLISESFNYVMDLVSQLTNFIKAEIDKLIKAMIGNMRLGLADFLSFLHLDPCLKGLASNVTTDASRSLL